MKFALNYSEPASILLQQKLINFDLFKAPDWPELIPIVSDQHSVYIHFSLSTCDQSIPTTNWGFIEKVLAETETNHVNIHINAPRNLDPSSTSVIQQSIDQMLSEVEMVVSRFGADNVVIENCPMCSIGYEFQLPAVLPDTLERIVCQTGCGFLFDISHARITAATNGWQEKDYINQLPLDRLQELHITGLRVYENMLTDHFELSPEDWLITEWAAQQIAQGIWSEPGIAAFEYGGLGPVFSFRNNIDVIAEQTPRLYSMFSTTSRQSALSS